MKISHTVYKKIVITFFLSVSLMTIGQPLQTYEVAAEKFDTAAVKHIYFDTKFAELHMQTGSPREISVKITLNIKANPQTAQAYLQAFNTRIARDGDAVYVKTHTPTDEEIATHDNTEDMEPRIIIEAVFPKNMHVHILSDYMKIRLNELDGPFQLDSDFSNLEIGYLNHENNILKGDYLNGKIRFLHSGKIQSDFSKLQINLAFVLHLDSDYGKYNIRRIRKLFLNGDFIKLESDRIYYINARTDNSTFHIKRIYNLNLEGDFNELIINELPLSFKMINLDGDYLNTRINNPKKVSYLFDIKMQNGIFKNKGLIFTGKKFTGSSGRQYKGYYGSNEAKAVIKIRQDYGEIYLFNPE
jgi:hypothetical protein